MTYSSSNGRFGESGVSPVVGAVLMVAAVVVLSAIIGGFVTNLGQNTGENPQAGLSFDNNGDGTVTVQAISMDKAEKVNLRVDGESVGELNSVGESLVIDSGSITAVGVLEGEKAIVASTDITSFSEASGSPGSVSLSEMEGEGTDSNPYVIRNDQQLQAMNQDLTASYVLGNNIDATRTDEWNGGDGFTPVGTVDQPFTGELDGDGEKIRGLTVNTGNRVGMFRFMGSGSVVSDMVLLESRTDAGFNVGAVAGKNRGLIESVSVSGSVSGVSTVGGVVGANEGTIRQTAVEVTVEGDDKNVGGIAGGNFRNGDIINSYSEKSVTGFENVGGVAGLNSGTATTSYATGTVSGDTKTGGFTGLNDGTVTDSYYDKEQAGTTTTGGSATGLTTSEIQGEAAAQNMAGFNFTDIWEVVQGSSPELQ